MYNGASALAASRKHRECPWCQSPNFYVQEILGMLQQQLVVEPEYVRALLHKAFAQSGADAAKPSQPCRLTELVADLGYSISTIKAGSGLCISQLNHRRARLH